MNTPDSLASAEACAAGLAGSTFAALIATENETLDARFVGSDILRSAALLERLRRPEADADEVVVLMRRRLQGGDSWRLDEGGPGASEAESVARLVTLLNAALQLEGLAAGCTNGMAVRAREAQTRWAGREVPTVCVNRILIEETFPLELRRRQWGRVSDWVSGPGHTGVPWVPFAAEDRLGLALSGGGIRSATFNLGLLQALAGRGLLERFDYLATVSGGGYAGGFWTRWRKARQACGGGVMNRFPQCEGVAAPGGAGKGPREIREPREVRHLREFSRFLMPRSGLNAEFWSAVATILSGLVPSLLAASTVIFGTMVLWAGLSMLLLGDGLVPWVPGVVLVGAVGTVFGAALRHEVRLEVVERAGDGSRRYARCFLYGTVLATGAGAAALYWMPGSGLDAGTGFTLAKVDAGTLFRPSVALLWAWVAMALIQLGLGRWRPQEWRRKEAGSRLAVEAAWGRAMGQLLSLVSWWSALAGIWWLAGETLASKGALGVGKLSAGTAGATMLFYLLRDWLRKPKEETHGSRVWDLVLAKLGGVGRMKSVATSLLANGIVVLGLLSAAVSLRTMEPEQPLAKLGLLLVGCLAMLLTVLAMFDPAALGLHEFYRGRVARCFLGAGRVGVPSSDSADGACAEERSVVERAEDDMPLRADTGLPLHLVCCAANQTTDEDQLATLHRGARSVTLSRFGIAWGDHWAAADGLRLSSALTASAAAFNSLMGERTMRLGRAVPFVMTALNLRLGLWVRNPAQPPPALRLSELIPGLQFLRELFGQARCTEGRGASTYLHLSDGGHFENLALYELIRRHCRYIVVADAGEDAQYAFDDFGRATRRVREDFGVEIEIELGQLRPGEDGRSRQHLAVGVIHYDGVVGTDKGTIVYFKPTLTGDEPPDVEQYRRGNPEFPHQSTGDQFFDEAQFESYRRLGEHIANAGLGPLERIAADLTTLADETIFWRLRLAWHRVPWMCGEAGIRLCESARSLEQALAEAKDADAGERLRQYLGLRGLGDEALSCEGALLAIRACKFMEEAWVVCELDQYWSHSLADNWMANLHRWAALQVVREWWPVIKPLFGDDFQEFAERQLGLPRLPRLEWALGDVGDAGDAKVIPLAARRYREVWPGESLVRPDATTHQLVLNLRRGDERADWLRLQIGLAFVKEEGGRAQWALEDLFVVPEFAFNDYLGRLLDGLVAHYRNRPQIMQLEVELEDPGRIRAIVGQRLLRSTASRRQQTDLIDFYRSRGFGYDPKKWRHGRCVGLVLNFDRGTSGSRPIPSAEKKAETVHPCRLAMQEWHPPREP